MLRNFRKTIVFAMAVMFAMAPVVLAQTSPKVGVGASESTPGDKPATTGQIGTMSAPDAIHATVADVDQQRNTVKLKMQSGETVELKVPERSLTNLQKGDTVQVSSRKADASQSGMGGSMSPSRPDASTPGTTSPGSGTKSR